MKAVRYERTQIRLIDMPIRIKSTRKNNLTIFFGIFLVSMLFVPPSMPITEASSDIPSWIKNNADWWADGKIDNASFLKGIEYLVENFIINIPPNRKITTDSGLLQVDKFAYELPKRSETTEVNIYGKFDNWSGNSVSIKIVRPDGKIDALSTMSSGKFEYVYVIKSDFPSGNYQLSASSVKDELGVISFKLNSLKDEHEKSIPIWIRNNAGWWADGQIDDSSFVSGLQFLIKEGIIKVEQKKVDKSASFAPGIDENLRMYQTKLPAAVVSKGVFSAIVVHATHNDYCSIEENRITAAYGKMTEIALKKNTRNDPVQVVAVCMKLDVIKESSYPLVLKELGANRSNVMIFIGDLEANFESYMIKDALGWWRCEADYTSKWSFKGCGTHIIVVCDECVRPDFQDPEDVIARGMVTLVHEIGHHNLFEENFGPTVFGGSLHNAQAEIDYCNEGGVLESNLCKKLIETIPIMGKTYPVMNLNFLKNNWKEIDRIVEDDKITNWVGCKRSNYENGITGNCVTEISTTQNSSEDNIQSTQRDLSDEQKVPEVTTSFKKFNDPRNKFTVEYPDNWLVYSGEDTGNDALVAFDDQYDWRTDVQVFRYDDDTLNNRSDYEVLLAMKINHEQSCVDETFATGNRQCSNFKIVDSYVLQTSDNQKLYLVEETYTIEWEDYLIGQGNPMVTTIGLIYDEDGIGSWEIFSESFRSVFDSHSDKIIHMMKSFSLK